MIFLYNFICCKFLENIFAIFVGRARLGFLSALVPTEQPDPSTPSNLNLFSLFHTLSLSLPSSLLPFFFYLSEILSFTSVQVGHSAHRTQNNGGKNKKHQVPV
ncbi:hypothetical protein H1C71_004961 [Ictidomys tridecemlineatus]|nr:hypothetical protein H1C71_004961 [Ictidomys tridecemlineatus]